MVSRHHDALLRHLKADDSPIIFEGKHCCYYLDHPELESRKRFVRTHNVESDYYQALAELEPSFFRRWYLRSESKKLKRYQPNLEKASGLFCISAKDQNYFSRFNSASYLVPPFHGNDDFEYCIDKEPFCLYHGNLAVMENEEAARFLINEVFKDSEHKLIIFGNGASKKLQQSVNSHTNVELVSGGHEKLATLVSQAQVNVLPTFQSTGMKLKLLYSLYNGGNILVNQAMVEGTGAEQSVHIATDADSFKIHVDQLMKKEFTLGDLQSRKSLLEPIFSNELHARQMMEIIWPS